MPFTTLNFILPFKEGEKIEMQRWNMSDYLLIRRGNEVCESC